MTKISSLTALTGAGVDMAADLLPIVDMSLSGTSRNKKILGSELKIAFGLAGTNSGDQTITLTGDVTGTGTGSFAATIANNAVSFAKFVAAPSAGIVWASGSGNYAHNASGGGSTNFLRADGTWAAPPGTGGSFTAASTTEVLTGTDSSKGGTPDSIAALWEQGSDIASSGTISVGEGGYFNVTGTTTITDIDFATDKAGRKVWLKFAGVLTLTHHSTTLILPTGANITTAAGDTACFISEGSDNVRCVAYNRASGAALVSGSAFSGAKAKKSANQTTANYTTATAIAFDGADEWDTDSFHDPSSSNTRMTVPADGWYEVIGQAGLDLFSTGEQATIWIRPNGSDPALFSLVRSASVSNRVSLQVRNTIQLTASQYVELILQVTTDTSVTVLADRTYLEIRRIA